MEQKKENNLFQSINVSRIFFRFFLCGLLLSLPILLYFYRPVIVFENKIVSFKKISATDTISLLFVGDIMLSRVIGKISDEKNDPCFPFLESRDFLKRADITFGNLENPISTRGTNMGSIYSFRATPRMVEGLLCAGFDILSVANNHAWDYGPTAFRDTLDFLKNIGIDAVGGGMNFSMAHAPVIKEIRGTRFAFLGYTDLVPKSVTVESAEPAIAFAEEKQIASDIQLAKNLADIVVVSFHFGTEYETVHNSNQEKLARGAIDSGATLVIGHHPHVVEDDEKYHGGYIFYSLGNFVFDQNFSDETKEGLVVKVMVEDKKITKIEKILVTFNSLYQPQIKDDLAR